jgi:hypothetical protein
MTSPIVPVRGSTPRKPACAAGEHGRVRTVRVNTADVAQTRL